MKELATDNLQQSHRCDQTEVAAGLYPPSLKFRITYEYEIKDDYKRRPHTVSLTGSDSFREVSFGIDVFERPTTELGMCICQLLCMCSFSVSSCLHIARSGPFSQIHSHMVHDTENLTFSIDYRTGNPEKGYLILQ